jgi:hypothetical protein
MGPPSAFRGTAATFPIVRAKTDFAVGTEHHFHATYILYTEEGSSTRTTHSFTVV